MINVIILILFVFAIMLIKFILWTISVHKHNIIIKEKLGNETYNWMIYENDVPKPLPNIEKEINKMIFNQTVIKISEINKEVNKAFAVCNKSIAKLNSSFQDFGKALSVIKVKDDLWQM